MARVGLGSNPVRLIVGLHLVNWIVRVCVYIVRMARINVYVPDDLADDARSADLNVSAITQDALRAALAARSTTAWLESLDTVAAVDVTSAAAHRALEEARDELWADA